MMFSEANPGSTCLHMQSELIEGEDPEGLKSKYKKVLAWNVHRSQAVRATPKRRKIAPPSCGACGIALSRPFACLHCEFAACWNDGHIVDHLRDSEHLFCADIKTGSIYCSNCEDFIYDSMMDEVAMEAILDAETKQTRFQATQKLRDTYKRWTPEEKDKAALDRFASLPCQSRRGLVNLGQTCFLNAVLQCLVHNPLLRSYFLGDKHNWKQCKLEHCACCEMDRLFTEIYAEDPTQSGSQSHMLLPQQLQAPPPHSPTSFLHTLYKTSPDISSYAQHDAHECFISTLNLIHSTCRGSTNVSCNCIVHGTFGGLLQSEIKCERCGSTSCAVDPILDVSLEVVPGKGGRNGGGSGSNGGGDGESVSGENTLAGCLRRFTQPEKLSAKDYTCPKCTKVSHEASKRMSIRQLPPVLSFQFKRFEQKTNDKSLARKLDTPVRIPGSINMAPYTSMVIREMDKENNGSGTAAVPFLYPGPEVLYEYDLFAVIIHEGQIDNGHYTNYARFEDEWYRFDDDKVTHTSLSATITSNPYMCFYVKRHLDYQPHAMPSYTVLMQKHEALKEKERDSAASGSGVRVVTAKDREGQSQREGGPGKERVAGKGPAASGSFSREKFAKSGSHHLSLSNPSFSVSSNGSGSGNDSVAGGHEDFEIDDALLATV